MTLQSIIEKSLFIKSTRLMADGHEIGYFQAYQLGVVVRNLDISAASAIASET